MSLKQRAIQAAQKERLARRNAREHLMDFTLYTKSDYQIGAHQRLLCEKLEAIERRELTRLMVFMPPRHGKSELVSTRFPAWYIGRNPKKQIILSSYSAKLSDRFGRDIRNILLEKKFTNVFENVNLSRDSQAKNLWRTTQGGIFLAAGAGGSITGYGADLAIIDDPVKDRQDAESEIIRESTWDWYKSVLRTRLMPGGAIILVMTRWHVDDLAGRLMNEMHNGTGEAWDVLHLPAIATEKDVLGRLSGDALWPQQYDLEALTAIQRAVGERDFTALYQGTPTLSSGSIFKINTLTIVEAPPKAAQVVRRWDFAATEKKSGKSDPDWTVGVKMQRNLDGGYTVLDVVRLRGKPDEVEKTVLAIASQDGRSVPVTVPLDPGQAGVAQAQYYGRILSGYKVDAMRESGDKVTRADPFASQVNMGNVALLRAPWNRTYIEELADFPNGSHDDQVDASSGAFEKIGIKKGLPKMPSMMEIAKI